MDGRSIKFALLGVAALVIAPEAAMAQCGWCTLGSGCPEGEHAVWNGLNYLKPTHATCWAPGNCYGHSACDSPSDDQEQLDELVLAVLTRDVPRLVEHLQEPPKRVLVNLRRNAIQVMSCDGTGVVEHYALRGIDLRALLPKE